MYVSAGRAEQRVVGAWGRSNLGRVAALYPSGTEHARRERARRGTNRNTIADHGLTAQGASGNSDFEFASILSLVLTSS